MVWSEKRTHSCFCCFQYHSSRLIGDLRRRWCTFSANTHTYTRMHTYRRTQIITNTQQFNYIDIYRSIGATRICIRIKSNERVRQFFAPCSSIQRLFSITNEVFGFPLYVSSLPEGRTRMATVSNDGMRCVFSCWLALYTRSTVWSSRFPIVDWLNDDVVCGIANR